MITVVCQDGGKEKEAIEIFSMTKVPNVSISTQFVTTIDMNCRNNKLACV